MRSAGVKANPAFYHRIDERINCQIATLFFTSNEPYSYRNYVSTLEPFAKRNAIFFLPPESTNCTQRFAHCGQLDWQSPFFFVDLARPRSAIPFARNKTDGGCIRRFRILSRSRQPVYKRRCSYPAIFNEPLRRLANWFATMFSDITRGNEGIGRSGH